MSKFLTVIFFLIMATQASADIDCWVEKSGTTMDIKVIDTFVGRMAFINYRHPSMQIPVVDLQVNSNERPNSLVFSNEKDGFKLSINKRFSDRRMPPAYKGQLRYGIISTAMDCLID